MPQSQNCQTSVLTRQFKQKTTGETIQRSTNETLDADICGLLNTLMHGGNKYFLTITLARQRYLKVHLLKQRGSTDEYFHNYIQWIERHSGLGVVKFYTDNVHEFLSMRRGLEKSG